MQSPRDLWEEWKAEEQRQSALWKRIMDCQWRDFIAQRICWYCSKIQVNLRTHPYGILILG